MNKSRLRKSYRRAGVSVSRRVIYDPRNESFITFRFTEILIRRISRDLYDDEGSATIRKFNSVARGRCLLDQVRIMPGNCLWSPPRSSYGREICDAFTIH